jgi:hypothetical protein
MEQLCNKKTRVGGVLMLVAEHFLGASCRIKNGLQVTIVKDLYVGGNLLCKKMKKMAAKNKSSLWDCFFSS